MEGLLTSGMPLVMDEARTLDELLDTRLETQDLKPQPDGTFDELDWRMRTPREMFSLMPNPPSRRRLLRALSHLTESGEVFRTGTGTRHDPYRYWRDARRGLPYPAGLLPRRNRSDSGPFGRDAICRKLPPTLGFAVRHR